MAGTIPSDVVTCGKRPRLDSDEFPGDSDSPEAKRLREDLLLGILCEDDAADLDAATQDLAFVIKGFEEQIKGSPLPPAPEAEPQPDLGFLFEASDDELGLPPTASSSGEENNCEGGGGAVAEAAFGQIWGFEDEIPCYDALGYGVRAEERNEEDSVVLGGLFDFSDPASGPVPEFPDLAWRPESLPAL